MKKITFLLLSLLVIFLYSCEYEPNGVYNRTVNQNVTPPQIQTVELNLNSDSIYLYNDKVINFKFSSDNQKIRTVRLLIDGQELGLVNSESGTFYITCSQLTEGIHNMAIEVFTGSGTGSIADSVGAEGYIASKSWLLTIGKYYNPDIKATVKNGLLHITWSKYLATNFKEYIIYRNVNLSHETEIIRVTTTEFIDSSYVGESAIYGVHINTQDDIIFSHNTIYLEADLPKIHFSVNDSNHYIARWSRSTYYNAVDTFLILQGEKSSGYVNIRVKSTQNPGDTIYNVTKAYFGDQILLYLRLVPKKNNVEYSAGYTYNFESRTGGILGFPFPCKSYTANYFQVNKDEFAYINSCDSILRYSVSQKRVVEQIGYKSIGCSTCDFSGMQGSSSGKYLTAHVGCDHDIIFANGGNLNGYSNHSGQSMGGNLNGNIPVSDKGTGLLSFLGGGFGIYDFITSSTIGYYKSNYSGYDGAALKISSNCDYFFVNDDSLRLVQFKNSQFKDIWKVPKSNTMKFYEFDPLNPNHVVFWDGSKLSVKQCDNLAIVYEFALKDSNLLDIDYYNKEILSYSTGHLYIHSFVNGSLLKDIPIHFRPTDWAETCYLINHTIVYSKGLLYFVN